MIASLSGGNGLVGFATGALGSLGGSAFMSYVGDGVLGTVGFSAAFGGLSAVATGGDFWRGAAVGATVGLLNHAQSQVIYSDEKKAWKEMSDWTDKNKKEIAALEIEDGKKVKTLIQYDSRNSKKQSYSTFEIREDGNLYVKSGFRTYKVVGNVHTHPLDYPMNVDMVSSGDRKMQSYFGNKPIKILHQRQVYYLFNSGPYVPTGIKF
jgi:hypothetical protein